MSEEGIQIIKDILVDTQLIQFLIPIRDDLQITRLEHFDYVTTEDLENIGLSKPGIVLVKSECRDEIEKNVLQGQDGCWMQLRRKEPVKRKKISSIN